MSELGTTIRNLRKKQYLSIRKLAARSGVSHPYLSQIENGRDNVSPAIIRKLAKGLQCNFAGLMNVAGHEVEEEENMVEVSQVQVLSAIATNLMLIAHDCHDIETVMELNELAEKIVEII